MGQAGKQPLDYADPPRQRRRWRPFHVFLLPLAWLPAAMGSRIYYGDEYIPFLMSQLPAWPVLFLAQHVSTQADVLFMVAIWTNFLLMLLFGLAMDLLHVWRRAWLVFPPMVVGFVMSRFFILDTIPPRATPWPAGSEWSPVFLFPAWAWAAYAFTLLMILLTLLARAGRWAWTRLK